MNFSDYVTDTQALTRDSNALLTPLSQLTRWINRARYLCCLHTGCIERLIAGNCPSGTSSVPGYAIPDAAQPGNKLSQSFQTIANVEKYPFAYANKFLRANYPGIKGIIEVKNVAISWGSFRPVMRYTPWEDMQAYCRAYNIGVYNYPLIWSVTTEGEKGEVWLWPPPSITGVSSLIASQGEMEWLCSCIPFDMHSNSDIESIPEPFQQSIPFAAAAYCFLGAQRPGSAQIYMDMFTDQLGIERISVDRGQPGNPYWTY